MEKERIQEKIRAEKVKLSEQMQLKKKDRNPLFIDSIKGRISDLQAQINPEKIEEKKAAGEKSRRQEQEFQVWKKDLRERYLAFIKTVDENPDPKTGFAFRISDTLEIDVLFDLMRKHQDPKYNIDAPVGVIKYFQNKARHDKKYTVEHFKQGMDRTVAELEPLPGAEPKPHELHRGDPQVSGDPDGERGLPAGEARGGEGGYIPDL